MGRRISDAKREEIKQAVKAYERHCDQYQRDEVFRLAMQLNLAEETVQEVWEESL